MRIKELIRSVSGFAVRDDFEVQGVSCNSKEVDKGFLFVAIKGTRQNGHQFIQEAINNGAQAIIIQGAGSRGEGIGKIPFIQVPNTRRVLAKLAAEFYGQPSAKIKVIGITGTNGKTTVSYLIEAILKEARRKAAVIGTINYRFQDRIIPAKNTTPGPIELQSMFSDMLKRGIGYAVMEVSSHALQQNRTEGVNFHSVIFTNLTQDHLDYHQNKENYFQAKAKLFTEINSDAYCFINNDDSYGRRLKKMAKGKIISYGIDTCADIVAEEINFDLAQTRFVVRAPGKKMQLKTHLIGRHNVYNILAALSWALQEGIDLPLIKSALDKLYRIPGRLEKIDFKGDFSIFVDYAHTEDALKNVITTLREVARGRIIVVFGCGGERDRNKRPKMGRVVSRLAHYAVITNDNPRSEDPLEIIYEITKGIRKNNYCVIPDRREAIEKVLGLAKKGDIVLVAGKGHENYQLLKEKTVPFNDTEVIRECLKLKN